MATISSPRNVVIDQAVVQVVKDQVAALLAPPYSVNKIILTSHLQAIDRRRPRRRRDRRRHRDLGRR